MAGEILTTLPNHYQTQFEQNWDFLCQQMETRFRDKVRVEPVNGKERRFSQIGEVGPMRLITTRNGQTIPADSPLAQRWLRPAGYDFVTWIDEWDEISLGTLPAPESEHVRAHAMAANRNVDDVIIEAATGTSYIGSAGTTAVTLGSGQQVAVDYVESGSTANSGMTIAKLRRAKYILDSNECTEGARYVAMTSKQIQELLATTEITSADFNTVRALVAGEIDTFLGFKFVRSERLSLNASTDVRTCFAWVKDAVVLGVGQGRKARMDILPTQNHTIQIRTTEVIGGTRLQEEGVVLIYADESP